MTDGEKSISGSESGGLARALHFLAVSSVASIVLSVAIGLFIQLRPLPVQNETMLDCYRRTGGLEQCKQT
jgi:hypothetical protein